MTAFSQDFRLKAPTQDQDVGIAQPKVVKLLDADAIRAAAKAGQKFDVCDLKVTVHTSCPFGLKICQQYNGAPTLSRPFWSGSSQLPGSESKLVHEVIATHGTGGYLATYSAKRTFTIQAPAAAGATAPSDVVIAIVFDMSARSLSSHCNNNFWGMLHIEGVIKSADSVARAACSAAKRAAAGRFAKKAAGGFAKAKKVVKKRKVISRKAANDVLANVSASKKPLRGAVLKPKQKAVKKASKKRSARSTFKSI